MNKELPISGYKADIVKAVQENDVVIITAETGAGKSTQVPQYLMEDGKRVVVTQPRRLAARTLAERVTEENARHNSEAAQLANSTRSKLGDVIGYRTAFERMDSSDTRVLFCTDGLQVVRELLGDQQTDVLIIDEVHEWNINIETLIAWSRKQIQEGKKTKLVLMSATLEAEKLAKFYGENVPVISVPGRLYPVEQEEAVSHSMTDEIIKLVNEGRNVLVFQPGKKEIEDTIRELEERKVNAELLPLHGQLSPEEQNRCFKSYKRPKVVVATNVAQTSITIDDIDAVVDSGMERRVELSDNIEGLYLKPISQADCEQRKGRAGRCKEGKYILAADETLDERPRFPKAEIERRRLDQLVLRLASIGLDATELEFFHQPDKKVLLEAKRALHALGAMTKEGEVTEIGHLMAKLPLSVQYSRMIIEAKKYNVVDDVLTIVSILEVGGLKDRTEHWKELTNERESDILAELDLWKAAQGKSTKELREMGIHTKQLWRAQELRDKISLELRKHNIPSVSIGNKQYILKACVAGMVDHLYQSAGWRGEYQNGEAGTRKMDRKSVVLNNPEWITGLPKVIEFKDRYGLIQTMNLVSMITKVDPKWLTDVAPQLLETERRNMRWSHEHECVVEDEITLFNGMEIKRELAEAKPSSETERIKAAADEEIRQRILEQEASALYDEVYAIWRSLNGIYDLSEYGFPRFEIDNIFSLAAILIHGQSVDCFTVLGKDPEKALEMLKTLKIRLEGVTQQPSADASQDNANQLTYKSGRIVECTCGCSVRITKGEIKRYHKGEPIQVTCQGCKTSESIQKKVNTGSELEES